MLTSTKSNFFQGSVNEESKFFIYSCLNELYQANHTKLAQGEFDEMVDKCIAEAERLNSREILKQLAFVLFSGPRVNYCTINQKLLKRQWSFTFMINDESTNLHDIIFVLRDCYACWKEIKCNHEFKILENKNNLSFLSPVSDGRLKDVSGEDDILITHGGGYYHIQSFLNGKTIGYPLEGNCGLGLQVHVSDHDKTLHYACAKSWLHMDEPACLLAKIKAKYLCIQNHNRYEAGLRSEYFSQLKDVQVIRMPHYWLGNGIDTLLTDNPYSHLPDLQNQINGLVKQFEDKGSEDNGAKQRELWKLGFAMHDEKKSNNVIKFS